MFSYQKEENFAQYISKLTKLKDHIVIISIRDTFGFFLRQPDIDALKSFGLKEIDYENIRNNHWKGYAAVISRQKVVFEKMGARDESVRFSGDVEGVSLDVLSAPLKNICISSVLINGEEYSLDRRSFNIVVYYLPKAIITDSVSFDLHAREQTCFRNLDNTYRIFKSRPKRSLLIRDIEPLINRLKLENIFSATAVDKAKLKIKDMEVSPVSDEKAADKKIRVRFFYWGWFTFWNAIESVIENFRDDSKYDVLFVYLSLNNDEAIQRLSKAGIKAVSDDAYEIEKDKPDIAVFNYAPGFYKDCSSIKLRVYINLGLVIGIHEKRNPDMVLHHLCGRLQGNMDMIIVEKNLYSEVIKSKNCQIHKWFPMGNPKFDSIYKKVHSQKEIPMVWDKIKGKKIILWAFDHEWDTVSVTFDLYVKAFIDYFNENNDMALIIRPHPNYSYELIRRGIWSQEDLEVVKEICDQSNNIIWDESADYGIAYKLSHAVITDINCGITVSALALDKPLAVLHRFDADNPQEPQHPEIMENIYNIYGKDDLYDFFRMIEKGEDYLKEERKMIIEKYISHFDGKNGERIKDFVEERYNEITQVRM